MANNKTQYFVDPAGGNDTTGDGTISTPWKTVQNALDTITRDTGDGDQINVKAGSDDTLAAALDFTTYGNPSQGAPLIFRGYTSAQDDGGIGGIDCGGSNGLVSSGIGGLHFVDMHLHNSGANTLFQMGSWNSVIGCEIDNCTGVGNHLVSMGTYGLVANCHLHNGQDRAVNSSTSAFIYGNYIKNDTTNKFVRCIHVTYQSCHNNIISIDGATDAIYLSSDNAVARNNSIFSNGGSGAGIELNSGYGVIQVFNNVVEGFTGGGKGIDFAGSNEARGLCAYNSVYNCTTNFTNDSSTDAIIVENNETLSNSPFDKSGSDTYANRATYFAPADEGNMRGGAWPTDLRLDRGAVQHADPAGGAFVGRQILRVPYRGTSGKRGIIRR